MKDIELGCGMKLTAQVFYQGDRYKLPSVTLHLRDPQGGSIFFEDEVSWHSVKIIVLRENLPQVIEFLQEIEKEFETGEEEAR
jgi:hypothetical protein